MEHKPCPSCGTDKLVGEAFRVRCLECGYQRKLPIKQAVKNWARESSPWLRLLLITFLAFTVFKYTSDYRYVIERHSNFISMIDLGIHELGHVIFMFTGRLMATLGGSIFQLIVPVIAIIGFWRQRYYFATSTAIIWLGLNFYDVALYAGDARARSLPLVSISGGSYDQAHDWYQILSRFDALNMDGSLASLFRGLGILCFIVGFGLAAYLLWLMTIKPQSEKRLSTDQYKIFD